MKMCLSMVYGKCTNDCVCVPCIWTSREKVRNRACTHQAISKWSRMRIALKRSYFLLEKKVWINAKGNRIFVPQSTIHATEEITLNYFSCFDRSMSNTVSTCHACGYRKCKGAFSPVESYVTRRMCEKHKKEIRMEWERGRATSTYVPVCIYFYFDSWLAVLGV